MDHVTLRDICQNNGIRRLVTYRLVNNQCVLVTDTATDEKISLPTHFSCSDYYYTANSRIILSSGWQVVHENICTFDFDLSKQGYRAYLPVQDLWTTRVLFLVQLEEQHFEMKPPPIGSLNGFLEALARRLHLWMAGDELKHFIDDSTNKEQHQTAKLMISQVVGHELRNPVANLLSLCQTQEIQPSSTVHDYADFAVNVSKYTNQIWTMIEKMELLMDVTGQASQNPKPAQLIDFRLIINSVIEAETKIYSEYSGKVYVNCVDHPLMVRVAPALIRICVSEIIKNAFEFGNGSAIKVVIFQTGDRVVFDVEDEGLPIAAGQDELIFLRYFQGSKEGANSLSSKNRRGLGLGLYLARHVAEMHAGQLHFVRGGSKKGTFRMTIPLADVEEKLNVS